MSEIPEDIIKTAETVYRNDANCPVNTIARAILAERERCAKIADEYKLIDHPRLSPGSEMNAWWSGQEKAASDVASAIRKPITNPTRSGPPPR